MSSTGSGNESYEVTAKARITFDKSAGGTFTNLPLNGMFTGSIDGKQLMTQAPTGSINISNFIVLNMFMSKAEVDLKLTAPDKETYDKIAQGVPVKLTVSINGLEGVLYLVQDGKEFYVVNTDPNAANG